MKKGTIIFIVIFSIIIFAVLIYIWIHKFSGNKNTGTGGTGSIYGTSSATGTGNNTPPSPDAKLKDFIGKTIIASYDGTPIYDNDLKQVTTYMTGDTIGWMGNEATGYTCCANRPGFYKVYDVQNAPGGGTTGWCNCELIMNAETLKSIFGVSL